MWNIKTIAKKSNFKKTNITAQLRCYTSTTGESIGSNKVVGGFDFNLIHWYLERLGNRLNHLIKIHFLISQTDTKLKLPNLLTLVFKPWPISTPA